MRRCHTVNTMVQEQRAFLVSFEVTSFLFLPAVIFSNTAAAAEAAATAETAHCS